MNITSNLGRVEVVRADGLRAAADAPPAAPADGYRPAEGEKPGASTLKKVINATAWGSGGFLLGHFATPVTQWLGVQAAMGLASLGAAGPAFAVLAMAETAIPLITMGAMTVGGAVVGWRTAG